MPKLSKTAAKRIAGLINTIEASYIMEKAIALEIANGPIDVLRKRYRAALWVRSRVQATRDLSEGFGIDLPTGSPVDDQLADLNMYIDSMNKRINAA